MEDTELDACLDYCANLVNVDIARVELIGLRASHQRAESAEARAAALEQCVKELEAAMAYDDKHCPLCTWRGVIELVDGVCPQCGVNWPEIYRSGSDERKEAQRIIAQLEATAKSSGEMWAQADALYKQEVSSRLEDANTIRVLKEKIEQAELLIKMANKREHDGCTQNKYVEKRYIEWLNSISDIRARGEV